MFLILVKSVLTLEVFEQSAQLVKNSEHELNHKLLKYKQNSSETLQWEAKFVTIIAIIISVVTFNLILHHIGNFWFTCSFERLWENTVREDMTEALRDKLKANKRCYCINRLVIVRFFNFHDWLALWKIAGYVIPIDHDYVHQKFKWHFYNSVHMHVYKVIAFRIMPLLVVLGMLMKE